MSRIPLSQLVDPTHTVVLTMELQKGIVGGDAIIPTLPDVVGEVGLLDAAGRVCHAARAAGARIVHGTKESRSDGAGDAVNCRIFASAAKRRAEHGAAPNDIGQPGAALVDELGFDERDIKVPRMHGMTPFTGTELDAVIRNLGARTVVIMGVSLNLGITGAALSALDLGYQVVVVRDAVVGIPRAYGEAVLENSIAMIATLVTSDELVEAWQQS